MFRKWVSLKPYPSRWAYTDIQSFGDRLKTPDVLIIGAGIVGLSIAKSLLEQNSGLQVKVIEKESSLGLHSSGRNSGVLHAGFYYSPDSLKARFCKEGNLALRSLCAENDIEVHNLGKIVVSKNEGEDQLLEQLFNRGISNGVELELLEKEQLFDLEPLAKTHSRFIWSPTTAVADPQAVIKVLANRVESLGGEIIFNRSFNIKEDYSGMDSRHVVNASGSQADRIAKSFGFGNQFSMIPFMGLYRYVPKSKLPLKRLVYPVPNPQNPFLGVHFTISASGSVKIGPTAIPLLNREQYSLLENWNLSDIKESLRGLTSMLKGNAHDLPGLFKAEFPKFFESQLIKESSQLVPSVSGVTGWKKMRPGIRAQLIDIRTGQLVSDFLVEGDKCSTHVLNAVSPGWTAALPFGKYIADRVISHL